MPPALSNNALNGRCLLPCILSMMLPVPQFAFGLRLALAVSLVTTGPLLALQEEPGPPDAEPVAAEAAPDPVQARIEALQTIDPRDEQQNTELGVLQEAVQFDLQTAQEAERAAAMVQAAQDAPAQDASVQVGAGGGTSLLTEFEAPKVRVVLNWLDELRRQLATGS